MFATSLDRRIYKAIKGKAPEAAVDLVTILLFVDSQEYLVLTYDELAGGLERLVKAGLISEVTPHHFCDSKRASASDVSPGYSRPSVEDYEEAVRGYHLLFAKLADQADREPGFPWLKVALRWQLDHEDWASDDDEDAVEAFADFITAIIEPTGLGEVNGFEYGGGQVAVLIFGKATDADVDDIYHLVAEPFRRYGCPQGSCIVRYYGETNTELVSDTVLDDEPQKPLGS